MKSFKSSIAAVVVLSFGIGLAACDNQAAEDETTAGEFNAVEKTGAEKSETAKESAKEPVREAHKAIPKTPEACQTCGTIVSISEVKQKGEGSGAGAVIGAIIGGVAGHQVGKGRGKDAATVAGAAAGGYAGHEAEKRYNSTTSYDITVRMETGGTRTVNVQQPSGYAIGDKVRVEGSTLVHG